MSREIYHPLFHFPDVCNGKSWTRLDPGVGNSILIFQVGGRPHPTYWYCHLLTPRCSWAGSWDQECSQVLIPNSAEEGEGLSSAGWLAAPHTCPLGLEVCVCFCFWNLTVHHCHLPLFFLGCSNSHRLGWQMHNYQFSQFSLNHTEKKKKYYIQLYHIHF